MLDDLVPEAQEEAMKARRAVKPAQSAELYRQLEQASQEAADLSDTRAGLFELLERLRVDERALTLSAAELERRCVVLESKIDGETLRARELLAEISQNEREAAALSTRSSATLRRLDTLKQQLMSAEHAQSERQREVSIARKTLGGATERMVRLDYKLRFCAADDAGPDKTLVQETDGLVVGDG